MMKKVAVLMAAALTAVSSERFAEDIMADRALMRPKSVETVVSGEVWAEEFEIPQPVEYTDTEEILKEEEDILPFFRFENDEAVI